MSIRTYGKFALLFAISALLSTFAFAGTNGKITGVVKDKETGDALPGVNVILEGTTMGAAANAKGEYSIINVPAGVYAVSTSMIGYTKVTKENVRVLPDFTTKLDFDLAPESLGGQEVVIVAQRPLIQKDQTMTMSVTSSEEIKNLPLRGFQGAANLGTGFVVDATTRNLDGGTGNVNVRGGRASETGVYLDGFLQNNLLTGTSNVQVANSAVEEVVAITGGFNAEFGRNQSGIIQVITKSGGKSYTGSLEYVTDRAAPAFSTGHFGYDNFSGGFGGPVIPGNNKIRFYVSGERQTFDDAEPSVFGYAKYRTDTTGTSFTDGRSAYTESAFNELSQDTIIFVDGNGNDVSLPVFSGKGARPGRSNAFDYTTFQGKITWNLTDNLRFDMSGNYGENIKRNWISVRYFNPDHVQRRENKYYQVGGVMTYSLSSTSFLDFGGNFNYNRQRLMDDALGWNINWAFDTRDSLARISSPYGGREGATKASYLTHTLFQAPGTANVSFTENFDTYVALKTNYVNQIDKHNQLKLGADFYRHTIRRMVADVLIDPSFGDNNYYGYRVVPDTVGSFNGNPVLKYRIVQQSGDDYSFLNPKTGLALPLDGAKHPISASLFGQNKMEYEGVVVNVGLRYDFFNAGTKRVKDLFNPLGADRQIGPDDFENAQTRHNFSPRLSVSFPVSEKTVFRMSYGKFYQQPNLQNLYIGASYYYNTLIGTGGIRSVENPNLKPEESTQYEVGVQRALTDYLKIDLGAYYKDIRNLINVENASVDESAGLFGFPQFSNIDRGVIQGVSFAMELRRFNHVSSRFSYTLQYANGTGSDEQGAFNAIWTDKRNIKFISPLDFDQRHLFNWSLDVRNGRGEGPEWGGHFLQNAGINFLTNLGSGFPYTPRGISRLTSRTEPPGAKVTGRRNSETAPWTFRIDMRADKTFYIKDQMSVEVYALVLNLLDRKNVANVYPATGDAQNDGFLNSPDGITNARGQDSSFPVFYDLRMKNGLNYDTPRQIRLGAVLSF